MAMNLDEISKYSEVATHLVPWLNPLEKRIQAARSGGHWCLWLDKYAFAWANAFAWARRCDVAAEHWNEEARRAKEQNNRDQQRQAKQRADLFPSGKTAALAVAAALANHGQLAESQRRTAAWIEALQRQHGTRLGVIELVNESRLLLHLGRASVLENVGLYCDRTTGLPLIPGTALKGVLSTWACWAEHQNTDLSFREFTKDSIQRRSFTAEDARLAQRILGDDFASGSESAGEVVFVGGFPLSPPQLGLDIVNPHHEAGGTPKTRLTPNTFLCVEPRTIWRFVFFVRPGAADSSELLCVTERWIREALAQLGIGAKTAAGYGRFRTPIEKDRQEAERTAAAAQAAEEAAQKEAERAAERARQRAAAQAALKSDYPNEATFKNSVLAKLTPGQLEQLSGEVEKLRKPENAGWRARLTEALRGKAMKDIRKRLRDKEWFPPDWLPKA